MSNKSHTSSDKKGSSFPVEKRMKRVLRFQQLYTYTSREAVSHEHQNQNELNNPTDTAEYNEIEQIILLLPEIDREIHESAPLWPIEEMNTVELSILRLGIFELLNTDTPPKVVLNEAIELAKQFGSETSPKLINGVLAAVAEKHHSL